MNINTPGAWLIAAMLATGIPAAAQGTPGAAPTLEQLRAAISSQLPPLPAGFEWKLYKNAVFPKPAGWHERELKTPANSFTYATSAEDFSGNKQFEMGMSVNIFTGTQRLRGLEAKKAALMYIKIDLDTHRKEDILLLDQQPSGDYERTVFRYRDAPPGLKPVIIHKFILANNVTDSLHVFIFESPEATWAENWAKYGTPILSRLQVVAQLPVQ
ncbi:MAG: hypothetical protein ACK4VX_10080 [Polaromonas sp.]